MKPVQLSALASALLIVAGPLAPRATSAADPPAAEAPAQSQPSGATPNAKTGPAKPLAPRSTPIKPASGQPRSIAGDLLDEPPTSDLDNQLLDGLPPAKTPAGKNAPAKPPGRPSAVPPGGADTPPPTEGPVLSQGGGNELVRIGEQMRTIERRLEAARQADADTPALQQQIVDELARLIEKLESQQNSSQSSSQSKQPQNATERKKVQQPQTAAGNEPANDRPAKESTERMGKADVRAPGADEVRGLMKDVWGQLPGRQREQMLQSPPEQFLPKYELMLEKYYKRLADEQKRQP